MPDYLRFGIPSFDKLLGQHKENRKIEYGIHLGDKDEIKDTTGICVIGPDGTGKSVLALHLASQYMADCLCESHNGNSKDLPKIFYISTDLNHDKANKTWHNLGLNKPFGRNIPFETADYSNELSKNINLEHRTPQDVIEYIQASKKSTDAEHEVCFIDLAANTAGDDWGFVTRLLALLKQPQTKNDKSDPPIDKSHPRHLVIIDAVEGFETYMGNIDAFGEPTTRRARVAQLARLVAKKSHLLLIVEETRNMQRLPEEFVTDTVIRLRNAEFNKYLRRTLEIEKTRGQSHIRGQHPFTIRNGGGSTTGIQENADDPKIKSCNENLSYQGYVQVFPSLSYLSRAIMENAHAPRDESPKDKYAAFGIRYLDNMLGGDGFEAEYKEESGEYWYDTRGLPYSTVTALIGDSLTQKTPLGRSFLSRCFYPLKEEWLKDKNCFEKLINNLDSEILTDWRSLNTNSSTQEEQEKIRAFKSSLKDKLKTENELNKECKRLLKKCSVAVLFTTQDTHNESLAKEFLDRWLSIDLKDKKKELTNEEKEKYLTEKLVIEALIESRIICRRMEIHDVSSATLTHIFEQNITKAQKIAFDFDANPSERFKKSGGIRVVVDDFNAFRNTYPEVREDPLFLPYLLFYLGREGATTLIIDTQSSSKPDLTLTERYESMLRESVQYRLYTWRVPFYGENRVAITAIPPFSPQTSGAIRELRWENKDDKSRSLEVSPHFELYSGLEEGKPQPIPLEVRFNASTPAFEKYLETEERNFSEFFTPYKREGQEGNARTLFPYIKNEYQAMHDFAVMQRGTRLDHTLIFQVDEFWTLRSPVYGRTGAFRPQLDYLTTPTWHKEDGRDPIADPYGVFQPLPAEEKKEVEKKEYKRSDAYRDELSKYIESYIWNDNEQKIGLDRIPFAWDFGFLLCKGRDWEEAKDEKIVGGEKTVGQIWNKLKKANEEKKAAPDLSWSELFAACKAVAEYQSYKTSTTVRAFDLPLRNLESVACLVLEIWASEIYNRQQDEEEKKLFAEALSNRSNPSSAENDVSILKWLKNYPDELYKTWLLLTEVIDFSSLTINANTLSFDFKQERIGHSAVATQHWYKSACDFMDSIAPQDLEANWIPTQLPGHFSVRGDWFLCVAGGSRSNRLADRALDLLSSKLSNLTRLQKGIGLPVRKLFTEKEKNHLRTRLLAVNKKQITNVGYKELLKIAPDPNSDQKFYFLWRSNLKGYDRELRIWHEWLNMMIHWWSSLKHKDASKWINGFTVCKWVDNYKEENDENLKGGWCNKLESLDSWKEFPNWTQMLIDSLEQVCDES